MRLPVACAQLCARVWDALMTARVLFVSVLCCFPAFLFQRNTAVLACEAALFFILALTRRGNVRLLPALLVIAGVSFFSLLSPYGKVLFRVGSFAVTAGALEGGLRRGFMLAGMVFLSQLAVSPRLSLPGKSGLFLSQMFLYLDELGRSRVPFKRGHIISAIDERLCQVYESGTQPNCSEAQRNTGASGGTAFRGYVVAAALPAVLYGILIFIR